MSKRSQKEFAAVFVDILLREQYFRMKLEDLKKRITQHEKDKHYPEAFMLLSGLTESMVVVLALSIEASEKGFDGKNTSYAEALERDATLKGEYERIIKRDLKDNINVLKRLRNNPWVLKDIPALHTWRDNRNKFFHNFAEFMLRDKFESEAERFYKQLKTKIATHLWFSRLESGFIATQMALHGTK